MSLRRSLLLLKTKVASVARNQQLRSVRNEPPGKRNMKPAAIPNAQENISETKGTRVLNFGLMYGPTFFNVVSSVIANGPKVLFGLLVCGSIGYLYYLKNHYGNQFGNFKQGISDKYDDAKSKIGESIESMKTAAENVRKRAGQSVESARDTVKGSYEKVKSTASELNPVPTIAEGASAAKDRIVKGKEELSERVSKLKGPWASVSSDAKEESSEASVPLSEKLNSLKQKVADKVPSFGRDSVGGSKVGDEAKVANQMEGAVAEVINSTENVGRITETMKEKVTVAKEKLSTWSKEGKEN